MQKSHFLLIGAIFFCLALHAQTFSVTGTLTDSSGTALEGGTVMLLQSQDSVLQHFVLSNKSGTFVFQKVKPGDYILQITYLGYQNHYQPLKLEKDLTLDPIQLQAQVNDLDEVVVAGERIPMAIKKDTIIYNANAFKTQPNDNVEELLRQLPGVQVVRDGSIKAQGENITNVLVDGKEFFGNDPKMATKNLPANAVDKVEVFDKKSDMAEFSGIDDGQEERTINLALKEDKKKGYFGNVSGGYGTDDRFAAKANINLFSPSQQLSFIGMANNVNEQGFSFDEYLNFMGGLGNLMTDGNGSGRIRINLNDAGIPLNMGGNNGILETYAGGLNFNRELNEETEVNGSYFLSHLDKNIERNRYQETYLEEETLVSEGNTLQNSQNTSHRLNLRVDHKIDSTQNLRFRANGSYSSNLAETVSNSKAFDANRVLQNQGDRQNRAKGNNKTLSTNLLYRKRLGKAGRTISTRLNFGLHENEQDGQLQAVNDFFDKGNLERSDTIRQENLQQNKRHNLGVNASFTEPLGGKKYLLANYSFSQNRNDVNQAVFDLLKGDEKARNEQLSNRYETIYSYNRGGLMFRWNPGALSLSAGAELQHSELDGQLLSQNLEIQQSFLNVLPSLRWEYDFDGSNNISMDYETFVQEPSLQQLQPLIDNSDPLNIYVGNPDLQPEYAHEIGLRYFLYDQFSMTNLFVNTSLTYTQHKIQNSQVIDENFVRTIRPINVENDYRWYSSLNFGTPIRPLGIRTNFDLTYTYNWGITFINAVKNETQQHLTSLGLTLENRKTDVVRAAAGATFDFNRSNYSRSTTFNQQFVNQNYFIDVDVDLPKGFGISTTFDYLVYDGTFNEQIPIWKAEITKLLLNNNRGQLKLAIFDILNQNLGLNRQAQLNFYQEERINALGRYFLLTFTYSLQGFAQEEKGVRIIGSPQMR